MENDYDQLCPIVFFVCLPEGNRSMFDGNFDEHVQHQATSADRGQGRRNFGGHDG